MHLELFYGKVSLASDKPIAKHCESADEKMQWYNYVVGFPSAKIEVIAKSGLVAYGYGLMALWPWILVTMKILWSDTLLCIIVTSS